jgi:hypothetical protein
MASFYSGVIWIVPGGGGGGTKPSLPVPYYIITLWKASGFWEIIYI